MKRLKTNDEHHVRKYNRMASRGKCNFQTTIAGGGSGMKGHITYGKAEAKKDIENQLGHSIDHWTEAHTRFLWRWKKPVGVCADKSKEPKPKEKKAA